MRQIMLPVLAGFLLLLYAWTVGFAVVVARCVGAAGCHQFTIASFHANYAVTMNAVGGLVSALAVGVLAKTPPNQAPTLKVGTAVSSDRAERVLKIFTAIYLIAWAVVGATAFFVGVLGYPDVLKPLTDLGQVWLGLVVAAGFAYLVLQPGKTG